MIDLKKEIYKKLCEIEGAEILYFFPEDFKKLPIISYYELGNADSGYCGNEILSNISYQVDVWGKSDISDLCIKADGKMAELGFRRSFAQDLSENGIRRKTMRFSASVNNKNGFMFKTGR